MRRLIRPLKENSLTICLFALFVLCISAQTVAGWRLQNETLAAHGQAAVGYWRNLFTGTFLEGLASNWQAAFLQLASLIVFSGFLYQRGAPHSRDPLKTKSKQQHLDEAGRFSWFYRHSLFLAFLAPCRPGRRNISPSRCSLCSASFCASRTRQNPSQSNRATTPLARRINEVRHGRQGSSRG